MSKIDLQKVVAPAVWSMYGAPVGRRDQRGDPAYPYRFHLFKMRMVDHDYDVGGAYWGGPTSAGAMYAAYAPAFWDEEVQAVEDGALHYIRAKNRQHAKEQILAIYPNARFYR